MSSPLPHHHPLSRHPTLLQCTVPRKAWIDIIPHPLWRDNLILAAGQFYENQIWGDTVGGLFEVFPGSSCKQKDVVAWSPLGHVSGWEVSEMFWRRSNWSFDGCDNVLGPTNAWTSKRGEEPLVFETYLVSHRNEQIWPSTKTRLFSHLVT